MADRTFVIERVVHRLAASHSLVTQDYRPPTLEEDMEDISISVFGGAALPQRERDEEIPYA